jgi:hypothetical protein
MEEGEIINKVASSGLITLDFEELFPEGPRMSFDIAQSLSGGIILKEKEFREYIKNVTWTDYHNAYVSVYCSADAIIPHWALMIVAAALTPHCRAAFYVEPSRLEDFIFQDLVSKLNLESYKDQRVVVKGCSKKQVPASAYLAIAARLSPLVKSLMFGEPCSTVPVYKKKA